MNQQDIHYALDKQVPDMKARGFTIGTSYGQIDMPPGWMADRMAEHLVRALQCELLYLARARYHAGACTPQPEGDSHGN